MIETKAQDSNATAPARQGERPPASVPPGPRGLPVIGSLREMARDPLAFLEKNYRDYGDIAAFHLNKMRVVQMSDPAVIESVLVGLHRYFVKNTMGLSLLMGNGVLTSEGELWRHQRKLLAPSFQPRHVAHYGDTMVELAQQRVASLRGKDEVDMQVEMLGLTLEVVLHTLFDSKSDSVEDLAFVGKALERLTKEFERLMFTAWAMVPQSVPLGPRPRIRRVRAELDECIYRIIRGRKSAAGDDLLSRMLAASEGNGDIDGMSDSQMRDEVVTIFLAGHETSADVLSCAFYLLGKSPEVTARLRDEVDRVLGQRRATVNDLPALTYTNAVVKETMRLYPPVWAIARQVATRCTVAGVELEPGEQVLLPQWVVHRDPRWFRDPTEFRPERWLDGQTRDLPAFAYYPFGGGPRVCIGNHFAMVEIVLVLATLLQGLEFELAPGAKLDLLPLITLRPRSGVPVKIRARRQPS